MAFVLRKNTYVIFAPTWGSIFLVMFRTVKTDYYELLSKQLGHFDAITIAQTIFLKEKESLLRAFRKIVSTYLHS